MRIAMFTNTFVPHVGGVARSVQRFTDEFRRRGHRVLVVAPRFEGLPAEEIDVVRVPAIQRFNGSDFSVPMPVPGWLAATLDDFEPEIVHSHHPFLLGDTAQRVGARFDVPVVFTHHTMYVRYTHYVPLDSPRLRRFVVDLVTGYCNLCEAVVAPSESVAEVLRRSGVTAPIEEIPTGVVVEQLAGGDRQAFRASRGIPEEAFVVGHVGRLAPEKNLGLLAAATVRYLERDAEAHFLIAGEGPSKVEILRAFDRPGLERRLHLIGVLDTKGLADSYSAMDVFAFASRSETQGMVLTEAMAAGVPVVAVDAPGVREVMIDGFNGRLLEDEDVEGFSRALAWMRALDARQRQRLREGAAKTAERFSLPRTADRALRLYESLLATDRHRQERIEDSLWSVARRQAGEEWKLWRNLASAFGEALDDDDDEGDATDR